MHRPHDPILEYELVLIGFDNYITESLRTNTLYCSFFVHPNRCAYYNESSRILSFRMSSRKRVIELRSGKKPNGNLFQSFHISRSSFFGIFFVVDRIRVWSRPPKDMMKHVWYVCKHAHYNEMTRSIKPNKWKVRRSMKKIGGSYQSGALTSLLLYNNLSFFQFTV